jgi:hypothetical protein
MKRKIPSEHAFMGSAKKAEKLLQEFSRRLRRLPGSVFISIRPRQMNLEPGCLLRGSGQRVFERCLVEDALIPL